MGNRNAVIRIRATAPAKARWRKAAEEAGVTLSEYVREAVRHYSRGNGNPRDEKAALLFLMQEVNQLGSNVNQVLKAYHQGDAFDGPYVAAAFAEMRAVIRAALGEKR